MTNLEFYTDNACHGDTPPIVWAVLALMETQKEMVDLLASLNETMADLRSLAELTTGVDRI